MHITCQARRTALMMALAVGAYGQVSSLPPLNEDDAALLQAYLKNRPLGDGLMAFPQHQTALVPLGELCRLLSFAIEVDAQKGRAEGFFIQPRRTFTLDLPNHSVLVDGKRTPFQSWQVRPHARDLYVDIALLEAWFPIQAKLAYRDSSVYFTSKEPLPIEQAWERDRKNAGLVGRGQQDEPSGITYPYPYQFFTVPTGDLALLYFRAKNQPATRPQGSLTLSGDLFWMSSRIYLNRDDRGSFKSSRVTLYRDDPDGGLLGPLHARHVSLGDLQKGMSLPLVGGLPQGRGVLVDNYPLEYRSAFATRIFRGPLPVGWSVELFQNGGLVAYQQARPDGTYELPPIQLTFGLNNLKLVFHGPQGQRREENHRLDIAQDLPRPGAFQYRFGALDPLLNAPAPAPGGTPLSAQLAGNPIYFAEGELGLAPSLSALSGVTRLHYSDATRTYAAGGLRTVLPWLSMDVLGAMERTDVHQGPQPTPGLAAQTILRTGVGYSTLQVSHSEYRRGFQTISEVAAGPRAPLRSEDTVAMTGNLGALSLPLNLTYTFQRQAYQSGQRQSHRIMASSTFGRFSVTPALGVNSDSTSGQSIRSLDAQTLLSTFWGPYNLQGDLTGRKPQQEAFRMEAWTLNLGRVWDSGLSLQTHIRGQFQGNTGGPSISANLMQQRGRIGFGADASYQRRSGFSIGVRLQVSFGRDPRTRRWYTDAQSLSNLGAVSAQAFLDNNGNGKLDSGERVLHDTRFRMGDAMRPELRMAPSVALYNSLGVGRNLAISLEGSSLEDTSQQPVSPAFTLRPRAGVVIPVDYPVVVLGEASGTCRLRRGKRIEEMSGVQLEVVDAAGKVVLAQRSAFDGFFEFRGLPLGTYVLRVPPEEMERLKVKGQASRPLQLTAERAWMEGLDLLLEPLHSSPEDEQSLPELPGEQDPVINVIPPAAPKEVKLPSLPELGPGPGSALFDRRLAPAPPPSLLTPQASLQALPPRTKKVIRRSATRVERKPNLQPSRVAEARSLGQAAAALTFGDLYPWRPLFQDALPTLRKRPEILLPTREKPSPKPPLPPHWTIQLGTGRTSSMIELSRRRLGPLSGQLRVVRPDQNEPYQLVLGRFPDPATAERTRNNLPYIFFALGNCPRVILDPDDGVMA